MKQQASSQQHEQSQTRKSKEIPSKHLHARRTLLYQAATCLTLQTTSHETTTSSILASSLHVPSYSPLSLQLCSDLRQVTRKAQLHLTADLKRSLCKRCNTVLITGRTATQSVENLSKGVKKAWANVLVLSCRPCDERERFLVGSKRQNKEQERRAITKDVTSVISLDEVRQAETVAQTSTEFDSTTA
jgi:ribonuclease P protein subunit RPR2